VNFILVRGEPYRMVKKCILQTMIQEVQDDNNLLSPVIDSVNHVTPYTGADKSLARPGRKKATFPAFYRSWRFITTFTTVHHLSLP